MVPSLFVFALAFFASGAAAAARRLRAACMSTKPVIALPASRVPWHVFQAYYHGGQPLLLRRASDLSQWSFAAWTLSIASSGSTGAGSEADLLLRCPTNILSQRGSAEAVAVDVAVAVRHIFEPRGDGNAFWQWRTRLGALSSGQPPAPAAAPALDEGAKGGSLPPCVPLPALLRSWPGASVKPDGETALFVTSAGGRTPLHRDHGDNALLHLHGRKSVVLVDPAVAAEHEPLVRELFGTPGTHEDLFGVAAEEEGEPAAGGAAGRSCPSGDDRMPLPRAHCFLEPGDLLYIPDGWLHDVESRTPTVSAALRFEVGRAFSPDLLVAAGLDAM